MTSHSKLRPPFGPTGAWLYPKPSEQKKKMI
jgi:hypothetical protein